MTSWRLLLPGLALALLVWMMSLLITAPMPTASTTTTEYGQAVVRFPSVTVQAEVPLTNAQSQLGLGEREGLGYHRGMLWAFDGLARPAFWMKGMRFDLDFIWITDGTVTEVQDHIPAPTGSNPLLPTYQPAQAASHMLEMPAGFATQYRIMAGTPVSIDISD